MKKERFPLFLYIISVLLVFGFIICLSADYLYKYEFGSAPFYIYVLFRFAEFLIPAILIFVAARILKIKQNQSKGD